MRPNDEASADLVNELSSELDAARRLLREARESEKRFRILSELTNDYCFIARPHQEELRAGWLRGAVERTTGYTPDELIQAGLWSIVHQEDRPQVSATLKQVCHGEGLVHEFRIVAKDGSVRWMREHLRPELDDRDQRIVYGAARDVTERHQAQREHESLEAQLRQAQKMDAVGRLAGGVAHDFNNLLTVILTHCGFLLNELPPNTQLRDDASDIQAAARRAAELTQRLLAFSRQQVLTPAVLDLNTVVRDLEPVLTSLVGEGIELHIDLHARGVKLRADRAQLEQIILNFVVNARDAMPHGGKLELATGIVALDHAMTKGDESLRAGEYVTLGVRDTGVGMSREIMVRIFEPFFTTKEQGKGTGLGLSTVYGIVKQSGGHIHVDSKEGFGSTFEVFFPKVVAPGQSEPDARVISERSARQETILVVEDEEGVRRGVQRILRHAGYNVLVAADPAQAIALLEEYAHEIDLLLTDVVMPMMTGVQLAERIVAMRPSIQVLYMSGHARECLGVNDTEETTVAYLQKPFTRQAMLSKVAAVLAGR